MFRTVTRRPDPGAAARAAHLCAVWSAVEDVCFDAPQPVLATVDLNGVLHLDAACTPTVTPTRRALRDVALGPAGVCRHCTAVVRPASPLPGVGGPMAQRRWIAWASAAMDLLAHRDGTVGVRRWEAALWQALMGAPDGAHPTRRLWAHLLDQVGVPPSDELVLVSFTGVWAPNLLDCPVATSGAATAGGAQQYSSDAMMHASESLRACAAGFLVPVPATGGFVAAVPPGHVSSLRRVAANGSVEVFGPVADRVAARALVEAAVADRSDCLAAMLAAATVI